MNEVTHPATGLGDLPLLEHESGFRYRDGTADLLTIRECLTNYKWMRCDGRTVVDIGANIGVFTAMACHAGAEFVVAYEPDPHSAALARLHTKGMRGLGRIVEAAVLHPCDGKTATLFVPATPGGPSLASTWPRRGRIELEVSAVSFHEAMRVHPRTLKIDVEGAEYGYLDHGIPDQVDELAIELHGLTKAMETLLVHWRDRLCAEWKVVRRQDKKFFGKPVCNLLLRR